MEFMNEMEIDAAAERFRSRPGSVECRAAVALQDFKDAVNGVSDGWAYWRPASAAAKSLQRIVSAAWVLERRSYDARERADLESVVQEANLKRALSTLKAFKTRHHIV